MGPKHACPDSTLYFALTPTQYHKINVDPHSDVSRILQGFIDIWKARGVCGQGFYKNNKAILVAHIPVSGQSSHTTTKSCVTTSFKRVNVWKRGRRGRKKKKRYLNKQNIFINEFATSTSRLTDADYFRSNQGKREVNPKSPKCGPSVEGGRGRTTPPSLRGQTQPLKAGKCQGEVLRHSSECPSSTA